MCTSDDSCDDDLREISRDFDVSMVKNCIPTHHAKKV